MKIDRILGESMPHITQNEDSTAREHVEGFVHPEMSLGLKYRTRPLLAGFPNRKIARPSSTADLDAEVAVVARMNDE